MPNHLYQCLSSISGFVQLAEEKLVIPLNSNKVLNLCIVDAVHVIHAAHSSRYADCNNDSRCRSPRCPSNNCATHVPRTCTHSGGMLPESRHSPLLVAVIPCDGLVFLRASSLQQASRPGETVWSLETLDSCGLTEVALVRRSLFLSLCGNASV